MDGTGPTLVRCVIDQHAGIPGRTWCGRNLDRSERAFAGVDEAAFHAREGGAMTTCDGCEAEIVGAFVRAHATAVG